MNLSIYISLFNIIKNSFPWEESLNSAAAFAEEVVIAINKSEDNTVDIIRAWAADKPHVKIIETSFAYNDIEFDGKVKNAALQACTGDVMIQLDADEVIPFSQKKLWVAHAVRLKDLNVDCYMIPTLDLYGDRSRIRNKPIGVKFRMHKKGLHRGVWPRAWMDGKINTSMSDTCELLDNQGHLARSLPLVPEFVLQPQFANQLDNYLYTIHLGYLSLEHRANINKVIWADHWRLRSGHEENVETSVDKLAAEPTICHGLKLT